MEDQEPIFVVKSQFFLPSRKLRRRMNFLWAFKEPVNPTVEVKVRQMKRNIIYRATICATELFKHWREFIADKDKLGLESLVEISELIEAGICTPKKLRNAIYNRMIQDAADVQFIAAEETAASEYFIQETVEAAERAQQAATDALKSKVVATAAQFAKEAAEAAELANEAAENAKLAKKTVKTYENAKRARKAAAAARVAMEVAARFAQNEATLEALVLDEILGKLSVSEDCGEYEATPEEAVLEAKHGKLQLSEDCKGEECNQHNCNCKDKLRGARAVTKKLNFGN